MTVFLFQGGKGIVIVNAGGGMIDVSAYKKKDTQFEEIGVPQCTHPSFMAFLVTQYLETGHFKGSIFVTAQAKDFFEGKLIPLHFLLNFLTPFTRSLKRIQIYG